MLTKCMLVVALTVTLANGALAAKKQPAPADPNYNSYNSTSNPWNDDQLFDRAKGHID